MKNKIKPFIRSLIRKNIIYIIGNFFALVLIVITIKIGITQNHDYKSKIEVLKNELTQLQNKVTLMHSIIPSTNKLDEDLDFLEKLIPNIEDYFSVIYSLEKLSEKTNFIITSYNVVLSMSTPEKLRLTVSGVGDSLTFINFLKSYNYGGGRLITSDKILFDSDFTGTMKIDLAFYSKNVDTNQELQSTPDEKMFRELETLKSKVNFSFDSNVESQAAGFNYPRKSNPF